GEDRLVRGENERRVDLDALRGQGLDRLEPFRRHLNLHYHVLVKLRELAALFDHLLRLSRSDLDGDRAVDEGQDVLDHLGPLPAGLRDERGIRRHPIEDAPGGRLADLVDVRGVEEDLHHERPPSTDGLGPIRAFPPPGRGRFPRGGTTYLSGRPVRAAHLAAPTLWHHPNFLRLWIGQSVSQFGNQFTGLALQFLALKTLLASPAQMGLLGAMGTLPFLLIGLLVGVWVDRHRRRPILIAGDLGRGFIVVTIAVFTLLGIVRMEYLYVLGFATGVLTVFFDVSYQAYLPALVPRGQIVEGNSKLEASNTTAQVAGPVLAGFALKAVGYAFAIVADGLTFFFSAGLMARIATPETVPAVSERRSVATEIREGLRVVFRDRRLWSIAGCTGT